MKQKKSMHGDFNKKKNSEQKTKKNQPKSLDDFLATWSDDDDDHIDQVSAVQSGIPQNETTPTKGDESSEDSNSSSDEKDDYNSESTGQVTQQKKYLSGLKDKDPEFYSFLKENDEQLLNFDVSSSDEEELSEVSKVHHPPDSLEVASDESDFEVDDNDTTEENEMRSNKPTVISKKQVDKWTEEIRLKPDVKIVGKIVLAFREAIQRILGQEDNDKKETQEAEKSLKKNKNKLNKLKREESTKYVLGGDDSVLFNSITRLCLAELSGALSKILKVDHQSDEVRSKDPKKSKAWPKLNKYLKMYTMDLTKLLKSGGSGEPGSVISAVLKHVHGLVPYYSALPKSSKVLVKSLIAHWSSHREESVRVLSFMCLLRLARRAIKFKENKVEEEIDVDSHGSLLEAILKQMYMAYIRNVKFTSPNSWPLINFMRRSLAEIFNLDHVLSYRYAFVYIRQLTIHLRNAMLQEGSGSTSSVKSNKSSTDPATKPHKKDAKNSKMLKGSSQVVCNWQFVHSVHLWVQLLSDANTEVLEPLIYPLVQIITGAIQLVYTQVSYYPFRFHLSRLLIQLSAATGKFVPILPYYLDILSGYNFGKKAAKASMKPMDFSCIVKCSKSQMMESGFKDAIINQVYGGILECLHHNSNKIAFPELIVPALVQMRGFLKKSRIANYTKKIKQLLDKINENTQFVLAKRRKVTGFGVRDLEKIRIWEAALRQQAPPLSKFYESWNKVREEEAIRVISGKDEMDDYHFVPKLKDKQKKQKTLGEFMGIFGEDDDSDEDDMERFELKEDRGKKRKTAESEIEKEIGPETAGFHKTKKSKNKSTLTQSESTLQEDEEADDEVKDFDIDDFNSGDEEDADQDVSSASGSDNSEGEDSNMDNMSAVSDDSSSP